MQVDVSGEAPVTMVGNKWLVVLPLLVNLNINIVTLQPITGGAQLKLSDCCPCSDSTWDGPGARSQDEQTDDFTSQHCPCQRSDDAEAAASILMPALRAMRPFTEQPNQKTEPKPLLQPEVGLASSVLETLRQATDEEYQDALARDSARSAVLLLESTLDNFDDAVMESPKNKVTIFLNKERDDMDDNLPEPSHIQETRCINSPLRSIHKHGQLRESRPLPIFESIESPEPTRRLNNKSVLHRKFQDMDNSIGASNIKERVIQPNLDHNLEHINLKSNPALLSLFPLDNAGKTTYESNQSQEVIPKIHLKLRELKDNLDIRKSKVPIIGLKKSISSSTPTPSLQLSPIEKNKQTHNNKPLLLKDLLKLKDVELIPRHPLKKSIDSKQPYPTLKLQSSHSLEANPGTDNCNVDNSNFVPLMNQDLENNIPLNTDIMEPETSPVNSNSVFELKSNEFNRNIKQSFIPNENAASSENSGLSSVSSVPENFENQDNFDYGEMKLDEDPHREQLLSDNCNEATGDSLIQQFPNNENEDKGLSNDNLRKLPIQTLDNNDDLNRDESSNETFQIEFLEDFDTPIEFDNSSFIPSSNFKNNENVHTLNENMFNDSITDKSNILEINNLNPNMPQENTDKLDEDCYSLASFSKNTNLMSEHPSSVDENSMQQMSSEAINISDEIFTDTNEDSSHVRFKDLQDMSNSILSLSECEPLKEENVNTNSDLDEGLEQINNDYDMENAATSKFETITKETETKDASDIQTSFNANTQVTPNEGSNIKLNENLCQSTFAELPSNIDQAYVKNSINSNDENSEMRAEASEPKPKSYEKHSTVFTKATNDISKVDKHSVFLNNLKLKLDGLFSTTEKINELSNNSDDNVNESSNVSPMVALSDKLQRKPQSLLRKISLAELPGMSLNSLNNKFTLPNHINQPLASNSLDLLNFPRQLGDTSDASLAFTALSDKLRSHTENTIQNVKETFESTLKDSQSFRLNRPTDIFDTQDILESISNRRDDMKEKLEAIHSDLNDRFSSFQESILDHLSVPPGEHFKFQGGDNNGARSSYIPKISFPDVSKLGSSYIPKISFPDVSKLGSSYIPKISFPDLSKLGHEHNLLPHRDAPKSGKHTEISIKSSNFPTASDASPLRKSDRKPKIPVLHTTTTPIPSFIPRPKILKTNIGSKPELPSETFLKARPSKVTVPKAKLTKMKLPKRTSNLSEEPFASSSLSSRMNLPVKSSKTNKQNNKKHNFSIQSPVDNFRKNLMQKNLNQMSRNENHQDRGTSNILDNDGYSSTTPESVLSRMKEGRTRTGSRNNDEMIVSPSSHRDTMRPHHQESGLRLVEPLQENVPYKCKLICYKDS